MGTAVLVACSLPAACTQIAYPVPTSHFTSELVLFEDSVLYGDPPDGSLVYRVEGVGRSARRPGPGGAIEVGPGPVSLVHPALYDRATLRITLRIDSGEPMLALAHNGTRDRQGKPNPRPGFGVVLRERDALVKDLASGSAIATVPAGSPRGREFTLSASWGADALVGRLDLPAGSWQFALPASCMSRGGFALGAPDKRTRFAVKRIQVLWQDRRPVVLYDGWDAVYDLRGRPLLRLPAPELPGDATNYSTTALDLRRERSLIVFGGPDLNSDRHDTIKGWAVRDLPSGRLLHVFGPTINACLPLQGGGGLDGRWLLQSWLPPASLCWLDWDAFDRGDPDAFVTPFLTAQQGKGTFVGFHDPGNALDGSMARYLRIDQSWRGVNHLTAHPSLAPYAPFDDVAFPSPTHPKVSHTGPAGMPTQLAVRDRDRAWYEQWAYLGNVSHVQCRGYNLFTRTDDWAGPFHWPERDTPPIADYANLMPSLLTPGELVAPFYRFAPRHEGPAQVEQLGFYRLHAGPAGRFVRRARLDDHGLPRGLALYQVLMDVSNAHPAETPALRNRGRGQ